MVRVVLARAERRTAVEHRRSASASVFVRRDRVLPILRLP